MKNKDSCYVDPNMMSELYSHTLEKKIDASRPEPHISTGIAIWGSQPTEPTAEYYYKIKYHNRYADVLREYAKKRAGKIDLDEELANTRSNHFSKDFAGKLKKVNAKFSECLEKVRRKR